MALSPVLHLTAPEQAASIARCREPLTVGIPLPMGFSAEARFTAVDDRGGSVAIQSEVLDRWVDGSARWALLDLQADIDRRASVSLIVAEGGTTAPAMGRAADGRVVVQTGAADYVFSSAHCPFDLVTAAGQTAIDPSRSGLFVTDATNVTAPFRVTDVAIELNGPLRTVVRLDGAFEGTTGLTGRLRVHCFAGKSVVRIDVTIRNPRAARHVDGIWELGDRGSILVKDIAVRFALAGAVRQVQSSEAVGDPLVTHAWPLEIYQDSSGGEHWQGSVHVNRDGRIPLSFDGYRLDENGVQTRGRRATPVLRVTSPEGAVALAIPQFWQNFPKALQAREDALTLGLFPGQSADLHEIQGGEEKTHTFWLACGEDDTTTLPLEWCRSRAQAIVPPDWCERSGAMPFLTSAAADPHDGYKTLVANAIEGPDSFFAKREAIDEYGWRHFGEVYADHEAVFHEGPRLVSHYNNQYDCVAGCCVQFLRSGDLRWRTLMDDLARHVADIDIYHTDQDGAKYNHGLFWHTVHYVDAGRSTHRTYPRAKGSNGGGPSTGHLYTTGLMLQFFLTGEHRFRDALLELGTFVLDSDDGSKSLFKWLDRGPTGLISDSVNGYHGPGRASGNALNALVDVHRVSGDPRFLEKAEELIRRCIHPHDDIESRQLLDAERRWFYTMFLQSLGKYLNHKRELAQIDAMYAYAQASLVAYARWMATYERPYLDHPEILEYPTETWAAQDMRKCEVFQWASLHCDGVERARFMERAGFFFDYSVRTLSGMTTRALSRPMILLLAFGWARAGFTRGGLPREPDGPSGVDFGRPQRFVPQKTRAIARAKRFALVAAISAVIVLALVWLAFFG